MRSEDDWKMIKKKLVKEWGKIKLLETSAVGIPAYPDAHKSLNSLVKALSETEPEDELNKGESPMEEDKPEEGESESKVSETAEEAEPESAEEEETETEEVAETTKTDEESTETVEDKKGMSKKDMLDMMTKGFQAAIKASGTARGLVAPEVSKAKEMQETVKNMSLGELAIMNGIGKAPDVYGRVD